MSGVVVDIGTENGRFVHQLAQNYPDRIIVGIDPSAETVGKFPSKQGEKTTEGSTEGALYVATDVADLPKELNGLADQIYLCIPWGTLLQGIVMADEMTWQHIRRICKPGATVDILCGYSEQRDAQSVQQMSLPPTYEKCIQEEMIPKIQNMGFEAQEVAAVTADKPNGCPSAWASKLEFHPGEKVYRLRLLAV